MTGLLRTARRAFTLVELLVVIVILGILIAIAVPSFIGARDKANDARAQSAVMVSYHNAKAFWVDGESYAPKAELVDALNLAEPGFHFHTTTPVSPGPETIYVDVPSVDDGQTVRLCSMSASGLWFCLAANEQGALITAASVAEGDAVLAAGGQTTVRSWGTDLDTAVCFLATTETPDFSSCDAGQGGPDWSGASAGDQSEAQGDAPTISLLSHPSSPFSTSKDASFYWTTTGEVTTTECSLDGAGWQPCAAEDTTYTGLSLGAHSWAIRVSGPEGSAVTSYSWNIYSTPTFITPPSISGTPKVGQTLTANTGSWSGFPAPTFQFAWQRHSGSWVDIPGASDQTYVPTPEDLGHQLRVIVTGVNTTGNGENPNAPAVGPVVAADPLEAAVGNSAETPDALTGVAPGVLYASPVTVNEAGQLTAISIFFGDSSGHAAGHPETFTAVVFDDNGGHPFAVVAYKQLTLSYDGDRYYRFELPAPVAISSGDYWVGVIPGSDIDYDFGFGTAGPGSWVTLDFGTPLDPQMTGWGPNDEGADVGLMGRLQIVAP